MGRTSDIPVNRLGHNTIKEAALAQHDQSQQSQPRAQTVTSIECLNSIEAYGEVSAADVDAAEKRKSVHPASQTPYKRQAVNDFRAPVTRSQTQPPASFVPPATFIPFVPTIPATMPTAPLIQIPPSAQMEEDDDAVIEMNAPKEPRIRKAKTWSNWQLSARDKLRTGGPGDLQMMEFKSLLNPSIWNWVWDDKDTIVNYVGEDEVVSVYRHEGEVFAADDALGTLSMNRKLPRGFLRGPTPYLVANIGAQKESHYALVDTGSQVNILSERLANQLNLPIEAGSPIELHNASGTAINVTGVCRDVLISTVGRRSLQTFLVTSTMANDFLLGLPWFLSVGARMTVNGRGSNARVAITVIGEDGSETSVKAVFSDDLQRTAEGLVAKN
jgi:hypothetical protein